MHVAARFLYPGGSHQALLAERAHRTTGRGS